MKKSKLRPVEIFESALRWFVHMQCATRHRHGAVPLPHDQGDETIKGEAMKRSNSASRKARSVSAISFAIAALCAPAHAHAGGLLPVGGQFVAGTGSINSNGMQLTINQTSSRGIIDWKGFSIGQGNRVDINNGTGGATHASAPDGSQLPAGLFGVIGSTGTVRNLSLTGLLASDDTQGGMLAGINKGHIANVFASGSEVFSNDAALGGLVGENDGLIERSGAGVNVSISQHNLGGLVGINNGTITQSYSTSTVMGSRPFTAGGLVAVNHGTISQSFVTGPVGSDPVSDPNPGAIAGDSGGTVTADNYWNVQTTGLTNGGGAPASNGLTTAQMSNAASFAGWDFSANGAWAMPAGWTHPVLRWQLADGLPPQ